ncbi:MAG: acetyl-CoA C-acetyltransferase [Methylococcales bacterium]|nr:acetyl-CoA C-acetyltransferase [Methylococcales bacterium]
MPPSKSTKTQSPVYIIDGSRTPFLKAAGKPGAFKAIDLALGAGKPLLARQSFSADQIDEVILGCVMPGPEEANIGRLLALRLGCGEQVTGWTVQRNCASGMQALDCAATQIITGRADLVVAGGTEAMSHAPLLFNDKMVLWFAKLFQARSLSAKIQIFSQLRGFHLKPVIALLKGLTDPTVGLSMGQTAENIANRFNINRQMMDQYAMQSHQRLALAQDNHRLDEIEALYDHQGNVYQKDTGLRRDSSVEKLAKLKPYFDRKVGMVTAGNSAQITDGACLLLLASESAVKKYKLTPIGKIADTQWSGLSPAQMGLGPAHAMSPILQRKRLKLDKIDYWEINEAFAAQVLACLEAWKDPKYCQTELNRRQIIGEIDPEKLNIDGGGVSLGHPVGASGARIVLHLLKTLQRTNSKRGIASLCIGGGQGGAMLIENVG